MDAIEIFFAAYGALLALAFAQLTGGVARILERRATIRIGWTTPLMLLLLAFDISSFVAGLWRELGTADPSFRLVAACLAAGGSYYVAAALVAPKVLADGDDLDAHFDRTRPIVVSGLLLANLFGSQVVQLILKGPAELIASRWTGLTAVMNLLFYGLVLVLLLVRNRATSIVMLATLNALFLVVLVAF